MTELVDTTVSPIYALRSYVWGVLKANYPDVWTEANYDGMIPIVPLGEEPELSEFSGPHIVYGYALDGTADLWARGTGSMTFVIYDQNFRRLTKTMTILQTALGRSDETARDINRYTSTIDYFHGVSFGFVNLGFTEGGSPEETEGGRQSALLNIRFDYFVDYNVTTDIVPPVPPEPISDPDVPEPGEQP